MAQYKGIGYMFLLHMYGRIKNCVYVVQLIRSIKSVRRVHTYITQ
jgi:hypothetical protein